MTVGRRPSPTRRPRPDDEGSVILVVMFLMFISIVLVTVTTGAISQSSAAQNLTARNNYLQGALTGVQAAVGEIRSAATNGATQMTALPCDAVVGATNDSAGTTYSATIQYYAQDNLGVASRIGCTQGLGPAIQSGQHLTSALIVSCAPAKVCPTSTTSAASPLWRRVVSTYTFETTDANIPGGLIYGGDQHYDQCLLAVPSAVPEGTVTLDVTTQCASGNPLSEYENFQYTPDWTIEIQIGGDDYCIQDAGDATPAPATPVPATLGPCTDSPIDQWGVNDSAGIQGVAATGTPAGWYNNWCLDNPINGDGAGQSLTVPAQIAPGGDGSCDSWVMAASVGSGGAAPPPGHLFGPNLQLVNYQEFGRCLDDTNQDPTSTYMIDYTCKQFPDVNDFPIWNQRWCLYATTESTGQTVGVLVSPVNPPSRSTVPCGQESEPMCLTSPLTVGGTPKLADCNPALATDLQPTDMVWTAWGANGGNLHDYTWVDSAGLCLQPDPQLLQVGGFSSQIVVDKCNASFLQKWNAPPQLAAAQISNTHEQTGGGGVTLP